MAMKRRMAMKVSKFGSRIQVWNGTKVSTKGGLKKADLKKSKTGKIVARKASASAAKNKGAKTIRAWGEATKKARKSLGIKGFCPVGGKTAKGQALLKAVRSILRK